MRVSDIRQEAMDYVDEPSLATSGKFSAAWWLRLINRAKDMIAQETGYYTKRFMLSTRANDHYVELPADYVWGIRGVSYDDSALTAGDVMTWNTDESAWKQADSDDPSEYAIDGNHVVLKPAPDRTVAAGTLLLAPTAGAVFTNQPNNDAIAVVSSSTSDTTQAVTIYGTTWRTLDVVAETITLTGTTAVESVKQDWGDILGMELSAACAGTVALREASASAGITTIAPAATTAGIWGATLESYEVRPIVSASTTSRATVGLVGTDEDGTALTDNAASLPGIASAVQPWNDGIEIISSSGSDTQVATVYGTTYGTQHIVSENVTLTGATQAVSTKTDWGEIKEIELATLAIGTITVRKAGGNETIATIAVGATRITIGDATAIAFPRPMQTVTRILTGAVPAATKITVQTGAALEVSAGALPPDMTATTDTPIALPNAFHHLLSHGAAALAQNIDIYEQAQATRAGYHGQMLWNGIERLKEHLNGMQFDRQFAFSVESVHG